MGTTKETTPDEQPTQAAGDPVVEEAVEQVDPLEQARRLGLSTPVLESVAIELASETEDSPVGHSTSLDAYTG